MAKHVLKHLDPAALAVALDHAEEHGLACETPAPQEQPENCVYLRYAGPEQLKLLAGRLPHANVQLKTLGGKGKNKKVVRVFHKPAILHVLGFLLAPEDVTRCTRVLDTVPRKYWKVI